MNSFSSVTGHGVHAPPRYSQSTCIPAEGGIGRATQYLTTTGASVSISCIGCATGQYAVATGTVACSSFAAGQYLTTTDASASTSCIGCATGTYEFIFIGHGPWYSCAPALLPVHLHPRRRRNLASNAAIREQGDHNSFRSRRTKNGKNNQRFHYAQHGRFTIEQWPQILDRVRPCAPRDLNSCDRGPTSVFLQSSSCTAIATR